MAATYVERRKEWIKSRRQWRKLARRARLRRQILRYLLLFLLLYLGASSLVYIPWFLRNKSDIIVHGNSVVTQDQIHAAITESLNIPIYKIDPKQLERRIEKLEVVKHAFVHRYAFPHPRLIIEILEEVPWATFAVSPDVLPEAVISQSGRMITVKQFPKIFQPALKIYGQSAFKLTKGEVSQWAGLSAYMSDLTGMPVESIDMRKPADIRVKDGDLNLKLGGVDSTIIKRIARLASVLSTVEPLKSKLEYIDLSLDNNIPLKLAKHSGNQKSTEREFLPANR